MNSPLKHWGMIRYRLLVPASKPCNIATAGAWRGSAGEPLTTSLDIGSPRDPAVAGGKSTPNVSNRYLTLPGIEVFTSVAEWGGRWLFSIRATQRRRVLSKRPLKQRPGESAASLSHHCRSIDVEPDVVIEQDPSDWWTWRKSWGEINFQVPQSANSWFCRGSQTQNEPQPLQLRDDGAMLISVPPRPSILQRIRSRERWT